MIFCDNQVELFYYFITYIVFGLVEIKHHSQTTLESKLPFFLEVDATYFLFLKQAEYYLQQNHRQMQFAWADYYL